MKAGNGTSGGGTGGDSLKEIQFNGAPDVELSDADLSLSLEDAEGRVESIRQKADDVYNWVRTILPQLDQLRQASREAQEAVSEKVTKTRETLANLLNHKTLAYRRKAWLALLEHSLSRKLEDSSEADEILNELIQQGYLEENPDGSLEIWRRRLSIPSEANFGEEEFRRIQEILTTFRIQANRLMRQQKRTKAAILFERADITVQQLVNGEPGECCLGIPPERVERKGEEIWRGGGTLSVMQDEEGRIFPLDATGNIEGGVQEAAEMGVHLLNYSLDWKTPPFIKALPIEKAKKVQLLWYLLQRGIKAAKEEEEMKALCEQFAAQTNLTPEEFFLEQQAGTCLAVFDGQWKSEGKQSISHLFLLVKREQGEERSTIQLVEIPEHLEEFLGKCRDVYPEKGEKFEEVAQPLRAVLQAIFGQVQKTAQIAEEEE